MNTNIEQRLSLLRKHMADKGINTFILTRFDPHQSAYGRENWNYVKYFSGFTGSAGMAVVTTDKAAFWTDGRYALQSQNELSGTEYLIFNTHVPTDISLEDFVKENTPEGGVLSFDERTLSMKYAADMLKKAADKKVTFKPGMEAAVKSILEPLASPKSEAFIYDVKYAGLSRGEKLEKIRKEMDKKDATHYIIPSLEDIAWTLNVRSGTDQTLAFEAYLIISSDGCVLFAADDVIVPIKSELEKDGVEVRGYDDIYAYIASSIPKESKVLISPARVNYALYEAIKDFEIVKIDTDITTSFKALKNDIEIENYKKVTILDGVSIVKFIKWVKEASKSKSVTEYEAWTKLNEIRAESDLFVRANDIGICGYQANGAIIHYRPDEADCAVIKPFGMLLIDAVGYYLGGTTDITRTMVLGEITEEMKRNYTLVLKGHIALSSLVFLDGMNGHYLDIVARRPLWDNMLDYKHGTGHGISAALSVHEGPQRVASQPNLVPIAPGMLISNEPGFYKNGEYGIRIENIILAKEHGSSPFGKFLCFETVSFAPYELKAIDKNLLTDCEVKWINNYHKEVYEKLSPYLSEEEKVWLKEETREL